MVIIWLVSSFYVFSCIITFPYLKILLHKQVDALCHCVSVTYVVEGLSVKLAYLTDLGAAEQKNVINSF